MYSILFISGFLTATISGIIGMAGGITLLAILTFFFPLQILIPLHGIIQTVSNITRCFFLYSKIKFNFVLPYVLGLPFGAWVSYELLKRMNDVEWPLLIIAAMIFYVLFKPKKLPALKLPPKSFFFIGLAVGILGPLVGATGPFLAPFFLRDDFNKEELVGTKAAAQLFGHLIKIPLFLSLDFNYADYFPTLIVLSISVIIGTKVGVKLLANIPETTFRLLFKSMLFLAGARVFWKGFKLSLLSCDF